MIFPEDIEDIRDSMNFPEDIKAIEPKDLIYEESRKILRFGGEDE